MKIAVIGETRMPVLSYGRGGLGRMTHDHAREFSKAHDVTLFAIAGSEFDGRIQEPHTLDILKFDAVLDCTHEHELSKRYPDAPIVNLLGDKECKYNPPNAIVQSPYMLKHYPDAKLLPAGVYTSEMPEGAGGEYLLFMGMDIWHKQQNVAKWAAHRAGYPLKQTTGDETTTEKYKLMGGALGLLCPYTIDAGPRAPLEAAACGTPTICLDNDGTQAHVVDGLTGYVCHNSIEMDEAIGKLPELNRGIIRQWAIENHDITRTAPLVLQVLLSVVNYG